MATPLARHQPSSELLCGEGTGQTGPAPCARHSIAAAELLPRPFDGDVLSAPSFSHLEAIRISWTRHQAESDHWRGHAPIPIPMALASSEGGGRIRTGDRRVSPFTLSKHGHVSHSEERVYACPERESQEQVWEQSRQLALGS
jgi:hypothetical protein